MADMPMVSDALKERHCQGNWSGCARYRLISSGLPVPDDLYPDDAQRAAHLADDEPESWEPALASGGPLATTTQGSTTRLRAAGRSPLSAARRRLRVGVGTSELADPAVAGRQAAAAAVADLAEPRAALVLVYASIRYDLPALLRAIREITGDTPLIGSSSSGHFHAGALTQPGIGVAILIFGSGSYQFGTGVAHGIRSDPFRAGYALAESARSALGEQPRHSALLALPCGVDVDHQRFVHGIYRMAGAAVPVVGGAASDDRQMRETYVFHDDEVISDAAVGVWIGSPHPLRVVRGHGWRSRGLPLAITGQDGQLVRTIAGRPALEVFQQHLNEAHSSNDLGASQPDLAPPEPIVRLAEAGRCLGIIEPDGTRTLRGVFAGEDGAVRTWLALPPYSAVQIMTCTQDELLDVCDQIVPKALVERDSGVLLAFSCAARLRMLRERGAEEAQRLQRAAGNIPIFGFYSYGELARTTSSNGIHNATITALAL
jgi:hypothetical protein